MTNLLSCNELKDRTDNGAVVVDVMTPEDYVSGHIPGARNACIYEMGFLDRIIELVPDRAIIAPRQDGGISAHAALDIDRTLWNVPYGSFRLFERLGMHLVQDTISLELFVVANGDSSTEGSR